MLDWSWYEDKDMCLFTVTGAQTLVPHFEHLEEVKVDPGIVVLIGLLQYFGPPPEGLLKHVGNKSADVLTNLWQAIQEDDKNEGLGPFDQWDESTLPEFTPETKRFLSRMLNLDPAQRATIADILEDPWWK
ncbi:putative serine threonine protein kinase protein [Eutypa lata UCREL1]|uniref:Putative serine threonine protein kinase protein n=1 Tax=Eutypa lata (strain UCR-EL1) TaxID=1287681 RepID=M7SW75_EUTLA|nr:putative serine threonine protein kinase protein [Eutypa lata UCREL1]